MAGSESPSIKFKIFLLFLSIINILSISLFINRINQYYFYDPLYTQGTEDVPFSLVLGLTCSILIFLTYLYMVLDKDPKFSYGLSFWLVILTGIIFGLKFSFVAKANLTIGTDFLAQCIGDSFCTYLGMDLITALMLGFLVLIEIFVDYRRHSKKNVNQDLEM